jgi:hypothetical protein
VTTKLIEHAYDRWLPTGQVRFESERVGAEKLQRPSSELLQCVDFNFARSAWSTDTQNHETVSFNAKMCVSAICLQKDRSQLVIPEESSQRPASEHGENRVKMHQSCVVR